MDKYFLYVRKSSEDKERQAQSIPDQIEVMTKKAESLGITIVEVFREETSAKSPGRPVLNEMLKRIKEGKVKKIITWKLNRLSRNPIDSGTIQYMLQQQEILEILTSERTYFKRDAGLMFSVESGIGNQQILDMTEDIHRGLSYRINQGVFCGQAPEGYINNIADNTIGIDTERFFLVRKMWDIMLTGTYTVPQLTDIVNEDWGYLTRKRGQYCGLKPISVSGLRNIFKNVFYTGDFLWKGEIKKGIHKPMITYEEFNKVQELIGGKKLDIRRKTRDFAYTGFIKCGECGSNITAYEKEKTILTTGKNKTYIYYRCSKRKKGSSNCKQKSITLESFERQVSSMFASIEISSDFKEWGLAFLKRNFNKEVEAKEIIEKQILSSINLAKNKLKNLTNALITDLIKQEEFLSIKNSLMIEIGNLEQKLNALQNGNYKNREKLEEIFDFIFNTNEVFYKGDFQEKRKMLLFLGLDWVFKDGTLHIKAYPWFKPIKKIAPKLNSKKVRFGPTKKSISSPKTDTQNTLCSLWSGLINDVMTEIINHSMT